MHPIDWTDRPTHRPNARHPQTNATNSPHRRLRLRLRRPDHTPRTTPGTARMRLPVPRRQRPRTIRHTLIRPRIRIHTPGSHPPVLTRSTHSHTGMQHSLGQSTPHHTATRPARIPMGLTARPRSHTPHRRSTPRSQPIKTHRHTRHTRHHSFTQLPHGDRQDSPTA